MASSPFESDFNEVEEFDEYNPHPYQGGYDIALTYGWPLPPSSAICYPILPSPPSPPVSEPPSDPASRQGESERRAPREGSEPARGSDSAGEDWGRGYGMDGFRGSEDGYRPGGEAGPSPELFGYWPFPAQEFEENHEGRDSGERDILNCAADYLFGYLHSYGEKRDESHNYGNLNYAYERHHRQEPLLISFSPHEPSWPERHGYHDDNQEEVYTHYGYEFSYGRDSSEVAHSEIVCVGSSWSPTSYDEDDSRQVNPLSQCSYAYERHYYEQPLAVQHEQVEHTLSQNPSFLEFYETHVHPQPADMHTYARKLYEQPLDEVDFIEKSWYQIVNNNESGEVISYPPQFTTQDDSWNKSEEQPYFPLCKYSGYND